MTPLLWAFEDREKLLEFYERGFRCAYACCIYSTRWSISGYAFWVYQKIFYQFAEYFPKRLDEIEEMLTGNRIWKQRLVDIGVVTAD